MATALAVCCRSAASCSRGRAERLVLGVLVRILLSVVELLLECFGLLFVSERQRCQASFEFESVEEDAVLVVGKGVVDFLVPYDAATGRLRKLDSCRERASVAPTDMSTSLSQNVFPTRSFASTAAP